VPMMLFKWTDCTHCQAAGYTCDSACVPWRLCKISRITGSHVYNLPPTASRLGDGSQLTDPQVVLPRNLSSGL
jgi:hypothetical protein